MSQNPISAVCPKCGSKQSSRQRGSSKAHRICQQCRTHYVLPVPLWERLTLALVFLISGLVIGVFALVLFLIVRQARPVTAEAFLCPGFVGLLAMAAIVQGFRELWKRRPTPRATLDLDEDVSEAIPLDEFAPRGRQSAEAIVQIFTGKRPARPLVPQDRAEAIVRALAEKHAARGVLRSLGRLRPGRVANARRSFAQRMKRDETPLVLVDRSFLRNGKAGLLLTNRGLYSSYYPGAIWLCEIEDVAYVRPGDPDLFLASPLAGQVSGYAVDMQPYQNRLVVNGKIVLSTTNRVRAKFWDELLMALAAAAREVEAAPVAPIDVPVPPTIHLELARYGGAEQFTEILPCPTSSWEPVEQAARQLDGHARPSLRIWRGQPDQSPALDVLGGCGRYVLRERSEKGWVYYDSNQGDEEIEVCTSGSGLRAPAFYVCTDLDRVWKILRHFIERGTFED